MWALHVQLFRNGPVHFEMDSVLFTEMAFGHVVKLEDIPRFGSFQNLDGHFTVSERRYHDRHHIILQVIENFVPYHPWICYAEVDGAPDAKAFYIAASCPEVSHPLSCYFQICDDFQRCTFLSNCRLWSWFNYEVAEQLQETIRNGSKQVRFARTPPDTVLEVSSYFLNRCIFFFSSL